MNKTKFLELIEEIESHYPLAIKELSTIAESEYKRLLSRVNTKLMELFPSLKKEDEDTIRIFSETIVGFLDKPIVMLQYIRNKEEKDLFMQKVASTPAQMLLDRSKTRVTNIRTILQVIDLLKLDATESLPEYFVTFRLNVESILNEQTMLAREGAFQNDEKLKWFDQKRIINARGLHKMVYEFCYTIAR